MSCMNNISPQKVKETIQTENDLRQRTHELNKRIKELNCLYGISHLLEQQNLPFDKTIQGIVNLIPSSSQYPEFTCVRVKVQNQEFNTDNFEETKLKVSSDILVHNEIVGVLEVFYLGEKPDSHKDPFLAEEKNLINAVTEQMGIIIEQLIAKESRKLADSFLKISNKHVTLNPMLEEIVAEIISYTGCEAVGIRILDEEGSIPYEAYTGFSKKFYDMENPLSIKSDKCMCIDVIKGNTDSSIPHFTKGGSFLLSTTTEYLDGLDKDERKKTCNVCNMFGYESVALIPIHLGKEYLGLIHLADCRENWIPVKHVEVLEEIALQLGISIKRILVEEELRKSNEKLQLEIEDHRKTTGALKIKDFAIESSINAIVFIDMKGNLSFVNPSFLSIWGYENKDEVLGKPAISFWKSEKDASKVLESLHESGKWSGEMVAKRKDGESLEIHLTANMITAKDDTPAHMMMSFRDMTQLKLLQDKLIRSERLAATGQLAASIAHEVNSPLQATSVILSMLENNYTEDDKLLLNINLLKDSLNRISGTVRNLLDLNRPGDEPKDNVNVNVIIESTVSLLNSYLKGNKIKMELNLSNRIPTITASTQQLSQVFINLINNAVEAMLGIRKLKKQRKQPVSKDRIITIQSKLRKNNVIITITDTGPGIQEEDLHHIFDPFYTLKKQMGMGIGLSICDGIIEDHGGTIWAKNSTPGGAVFTITLPIN